VLLGQEDTERFDFHFSALFSPKIVHMEQEKKSTMIWWLGFFVSCAALALAIVTHWPWLTLILPFVTTTFVKAMDIM